MAMARVYLLFAALALTFTSTAQDLQRGEYYLDVDPGFGNGTPITFPLANEIDLQLPVDVSALSPGGHVLGIRMLDTDGNWSLTNRRFFMVSSMATGGDVVRFEHFLDVDPGFGNGTNDATNAAPNIIDQLFDVLTDTVSNGAHTLFVRAKSSSGAWSLTNAFPFNVVVGIEELSDLGITAGPNPMSDRLVLRRAAPGTSITLHLMDALGRHLHKVQWSDDQFEFDTKELRSGTYVLVLWEEGRPPRVLKLSKP